MLADSTPSNPNTEVIARWLPVAEIDSIYSLIIANISFFKAELLGKNYDENDLTQELIVILNQYKNEFAQHLSYDFYAEIRDLHTQDANQEKRVDIALLPKHLSKGRQISYSIEAKRLSAQLPNYREKEYVIGNRGKENGGIQRFKLNHHGKDLPNCGMIGYVEDDTFANWQLKINNWIGELKWSELEKLQLNNRAENYSQYTSNHARTDGSSLSLKHIWIKIF